MASHMAFAAATAADEVALEKENDIKLLHYDTVEKENERLTENRNLPGNISELKLRG